MFTLEDMQKIVYGGCVIQEEQGVYTFDRTTRRQKGYFQEEDARYVVRMLCNAGICLDFYTDADSFSLEYEVYGLADRGMLHLDLYQNDQLVVTRLEKPAVHCSAGIHYELVKEQHVWNRVTLWLPFTARIRIQNPGLSKGAHVRTLEEGTPDGRFPGRQRRKLLCFGDSITQGYDAMHPSRSYAVRLSRDLDMELWNGGLSGYRFDAGFLDEALPFQPDIVTVAYGTNDWNWGTSLEQVLGNAEDYFDRIMKLYPACQHYYLSPLWRGDAGEPTLVGDFGDYCSRLREEAGRRGFVALDGLEAMPHHTDMLEDGILHPNEEGMASVSRFLAGEIKKVEM